MPFSKLTQTPVPVKALVLISVFHEGSNVRPFLRKLLIQLKESVIFLGGPGLDLSLGDMLILLSHFHIDLLALFRVEVDGELFLHSSIIGS